MIVLVDTNILLDVIQERKPYDAPAARLWKLVEERTVTGYASAISYNNVFYIARKQVGANRALDAVRLIRRTFRLVPLDEAVIDRAIATPATDFEDAIQPPPPYASVPTTSSRATSQTSDRPASPPLRPKNSSRFSSPDRFALATRLSTRYSRSAPAPSSSRRRCSCSSSPSSPPPRGARRATR